MYITIRAGYTMTIKEIRQHKNNTIRQQIFTYLIHVRKEISFIDTRFFTVSFNTFNQLIIFFVCNLYFLHFSSSNKATKTEFQNHDLLLKRQHSYSMT